MLRQNETSLTSDYTLSILNAFLINGSYANQYSYFHPIPELALPDADIMLFALSDSGLEFLEPTEDLWYAASRPSGYKILQSDLSGSTELYLRDDIVTFLGCTSRQQWCNPTFNGSDQCQPLQGRIASTMEPFPAQHEKQRKIHYWLTTMTENLTPSMSNVISTLGVSALTARFRLGGSLQGPIPDNQWQLEVQHWFSTSMAALQDAFVAGAAGAPSVELRPYFEPPANLQERGICHNQKVHSAGYMNFSIFGIAIIFSVGGLIIIASYAIEPLVAWLQKRRRTVSYSRLEWCTNETIQLQRLANEEIGLGKWDCVDESIPVARRDDFLAVLDLVDPKHPRLQAPPASYEDVARAKLQEREVDENKTFREETRDTDETTTLESQAARTV
ncbi:cytochrome p450 protein [Diplodia corticola]|uniref:Cytochrome p450 protein n=1 Tax=Diplodia corticola TaxID=236234 RepID=A0A1J9RDZ9_9PEZI|nr:cytochrome p450 protein [Diplodia corticola]OJD30787.1 cytochrome p450 protein [Diplodia corticola]